MIYKVSAAGAGFYHYYHYYVAVPRRTRKIPETRVWQLSLRSGEGRPADAFSVPLDVRFLKIRSSALPAVF